MRNSRIVLAVVLLVASGWRHRAVAASVGEPVSAFAANAGAKDSATDPAPGVTLFVVPNGRTFLLTDVLVANHSQEVGPLYLSDSKRTRCSIALMQSILLPNAPTGFTSYLNVQSTFSTGIPFGPGEPVIATLVNGTRGVDVTITGRLVRGPVLSAMRFSGGARTSNEDDADRRPAE